MPHKTFSKRLHRTSTLCDELAVTMSEIQSRLEERRSRMQGNMAKMARGLKTQRSV